MLKRIRPLKYGLAVLLTFMFIFTASFSALGIKPFAIRNYVTDSAGLLPETARDQLAGQLGEYARQTGNQILVVTIPGLEGEDYIDFTEHLFQLNKPGQKGKDNGIILLVALKERQVRIEVGYGLEEQVPDGKAGAIIRERIVPYFKTGDYGSGITAGVYALINAITPDYALSNQPAGEPVRHESDRSFPLALIVGLLFFIFSFFGGMRGSRNHQRRFRRGYSEPWFWGGGSGGGGFSGGGGSGGGFSGGGGGFGGGGAGGSW